MIETEELKFVEVSLALHPADYANLQKAARAAKLEEAEFCALAIHREAEATLTRCHESTEIKPFDFFRSSKA
ncbi:hypothetical protein [Trinickia acidisoli]|uniref:hypothetical protein n=1 Tax=Trinickia acidisoli TaxID=2767482 RepID=UPI001A8E55A9|nr:hypothetical protein [Trinickia acidisoli]